MWHCGTLPPLNLDEYEVWEAYGANKFHLCWGNISLSFGRRPGGEDWGDRRDWLALSGLFFSTFHNTFLHLRESFYPPCLIQSLHSYICLLREKLIILLIDAPWAIYGTTICPQRGKCQIGELPIIVIVAHWAESLYCFHLAPFPHCETIKMPPVFSPFLLYFSTIFSFFRAFLSPFSLFMSFSICKTMMVFSFCLKPFPPCLPSALGGKVGQIFRWDANLSWLPCNPSYLQSTPVVIFNLFLI